ncbi:hypothetical protein NCAS_0H00530 [Naumovozyma castellii]|uniref:Ubiquitin carboxyl-terminal hydrolase n=1 Tax=Naumovozyma castellii TaxID=27288 RepID=G0VIN7_NAUCA|nr:hypothetical protein NCAS_0H00530 [Naumovozyma castellii CBS 4309]CCC71363.1 hypothetical protein NCAS_0H00530 [Naumovozyma castellii CBS 4309]
MSDNKTRAVVPLESNPEVFTEFAHKLGLQSGFAFHDIYSLTDADLLEFLPRPVKAIILLFPLNEFFETHKPQSPNRGVQKGGADNTIWFKQNIKNACGLYAILHSLSNNKSLLEDDSTLSKFLQTYDKKNVDATDEFIYNVSETFSDNFEAGQTSAPDPNDDVNLHFITFVADPESKDVYELDGRNENGPIFIGKLDESVDNGDLIGQKDLIARVQWYMNNASEADKLNFSLLGLSWN